MTRQRQIINGSRLLGGSRALGSIGAALIAGAALTGCTTSEGPRPETSVELATQTLAEELAQKLEQNRLDPNELEIRVADYENIQAAAEAWWDTFIDNCIKHGNPRLSFENNLQFVASTADLNSEVYEQFKLGENLEVCKQAMMTADAESDAFVMGSLAELNSTFVANQTLDTGPEFERGVLEFETESESELVGSVAVTFSADKNGTRDVASSSLGFRFTVSDEGNLLWSKRP